MMRKRKKESLDERKALQILYGSNISDLTASSYTEAMKKLRQKDAALAGRVERILAPILEKRIFPRRQREWFETSEGTRVRLSLLPQNPYVQIDVKVAREILGIPHNHITVTEEHPLWDVLINEIRPGGIKRIIEGNLASEWIHIHRRAALGLPVEIDEVVLLPDAMKESAFTSAKVELSTPEIPVWLCPSVSDSELYKERQSPIDWTANKLIQRHRLPGHILTPISFYILTQDLSWLEQLETLSISIRPSDNSDDEESFDITVRMIDEFLTKNDWDRIWTTYIRSYQASLWERRGMKPRGRRTLEIDRLKRMMPLYQKMITEKLQINNMLRQPIDDLAIEDLDQETIRRSLIDLQRMLTPLP